MRFVTADSKTGEEQSLRKVDETLIVDFNFLTVLPVFVVVYENQPSSSTFRNTFGIGSNMELSIHTSAQNCAKLDLNRLAEVRRKDGCTNWI